MNQVPLQTEHLTRTFGAINAVDDLSMTVPAGIVFGFLGTNGAGKSTTIRLALGLLAPTSGQIAVFGHMLPAEGQAVREQCGVLLEHTGLYERLSALDNLDFYGRMWNMPAAHRKARAQELLTHLGLWERRDQAVGAWSKGMKHKLAVARALFHHPRLLFLDEPTNGLDPQAAAALRVDIAALVQQEGTTVFLTTHNLAEAEKLCSLIGIVRAGRLLALGSPEELRSRAGRPEVEIIGSGWNAAALARVSALSQVASVLQEPNRLVVVFTNNSHVETAPVVSELVAAGAQVEEVRRGNASLEDAFLSLIGGR
ncbi:MAG: ABC transporter ATP-binding protein [bacterium]|nr:ABC transporter ATP-binding protein [bacterium]